MLLTFGAKLNKEKIIKTRKYNIIYSDTIFSSISIQSPLYLIQYYSLELKLNGKEKKKE